VNLNVEQDCFVVVLLLDRPIGLHLNHKERAPEIRTHRSGEEPAPKGEGIALQRSIDESQEPTNGGVRGVREEWWRASLMRRLAYRLFK